MTDELAEHLDALERDDCYHVDAVLKASPFETTERVWFRGVNGAELGPFVRKRIDRSSGVGRAYQAILEAQRAGRRFLHLPRIVDCHEVGGCFVVVMEHVGGETLQDVVYRCDPSLELARDVFPRLCDAVRELHEGFDPPIIHRDLKPSNVMLSRDSLTIIDFGIARVYKEGSDEDTRRFGTRAYAPPEQFGFGQTDARSDVYALGMLLYFCLTEKTPDAKARAAGFKGLNAPEAVRAVIVRATSFDPSDRYASAAELRRAFCEAVAAAGPHTGAVPAGRAAMHMRHPMSAGPHTGASPAKAPFATVSTRSEGLVRAEKAKLPRNGGLLARTPRLLGVAWDVLLAAIFGVFLYGCVGATFWPLENSTVAGYTLPYRAATYAAIVLMVAPVFYLVTDRRPFKRLWRRRWPSLGREALVAFALETTAFLALAVLTNVGP